MSIELLADINQPFTNELLYQSHFIGMSNFDISKVIGYFALMFLSFADQFGILFDPRILTKSFLIALFLQSLKNLMNVRPCLKCYNFGSMTKLYFISQRLKFALFLLICKAFIPSNNRKIFCVAL